MTPNEALNLMILQAREWCIEKEKHDTDTGDGEVGQDPTKETEQSHSEEVR